MRKLVSTIFDEAVGLGSQALHLLSPPNEDSLAELEAYRGRPIEEMFPPPPPAEDLELEVRRRWRFRGLVSEDLRMRSPHAPLSETFRRRYERDYEAAHWIVAKRIRAPGPGPKPTLLYLHGWVQPETPFEELAVLSTMAVRLGMDVVQLQPPYHGRRTPRRSKFSGEWYWTADMVRSIEALRQNLVDGRAMLSKLIEIGEGRPVGLAGISLGGALTLALTGVEDRWAFSVPMIAHLDLAALLDDAPILRPMRRELAGRGWSPADLHAFMDSIGWNTLRPRIPAERMLWIAARYDRFFLPEKVEALWRRWGEPRIHWYAGGHMEIAFNLWDAVGRMGRFVRELGIR